MLEFHKEKQADCTIAVMEVPWEEASRFGIMACDEEQKIYEFAERNMTETFPGHIIYRRNFSKECGYGI